MIWVRRYLGYVLALVSVSTVLNVLNAVHIAAWVNWPGNIALLTVDGAFALGLGVSLTAGCACLVAQYQSRPRPQAAL